MPGPAPAPFEIMSQALAREISPETAAFVRVVFWLHGVAELERLLRDAGFAHVVAYSRPKALRVSARASSCGSTSTIAPARPGGDGRRRCQARALEREVVSGWQRFAADGGMRLEVAMTTSIAAK